VGGAAGDGQTRKPRGAAPRLSNVLSVWLIVALLVQVPAASSAQGSPPAADPEALPVSLDRIKRGLAVPYEPPLTLPAATFKVEIEARPIKLDVPWKTEQGAPYYVQTPRTLYHHEFLSMVTPEAFRSGVLYPMGFNVLSVLPAIRRAFREAEEARVRAEVEAELREFERQRDKRPPPQ